MSSDVYKYASYACLRRQYDVEIRNECRYCLRPQHARTRRMPIYVYCCGCSEIRQVRDGGKNSEALARCRTRNMTPPPNRAVVTRR